MCVGKYDRRYGPVRLMFLYCTYFYPPPPDSHKQLKLRRRRRRSPHFKNLPETLWTSQGRRPRF